MKKTISTLVLIVSICLLSVSIFAADEGGTKEGGSWSTESVKVFTAGFAMAFASALCGIAQGIGISAACKGAARNPAITGKLQVMMIIGLVFIESLVLYTLLIVFVKV